MKSLLLFPLVLFLLALGLSFWPRLCYCERKRSASRLRAICASSHDCRLLASFHEGQVLVICMTHGLMRIETDPKVVAGYDEMARRSEGGAR